MMPYGDIDLESALVQVIACCLVSPGHHPDQWWHFVSSTLIINWTLWNKFHWKSNQNARKVILKCPPYRSFLPQSQSSLLILGDPRSLLTRWGWETHICVNKLYAIIGPDNGSAPVGHQAIIWTNAGIVLIGPLGTRVNEILIKIHTFLFKKIHLQMLAGKWRPFCLSLNVLCCHMEIREI